MKQVKIDLEYLKNTLFELLQIPSPSGYTDQIVHYVCKELDDIGLPYELTRKGAIRSTLKGKEELPARAVVVHLDTLGAMVRKIKKNGRLAIAPIGSWSSRFAEGARCTIYSDKGSRRGTILPLKASGHVYNEEVDVQAISWENLELRPDVIASSAEDLEKLGFAIGDTIAIDPIPEINETGYINSRHLDNKAGVATILSVARALKKAKVKPPADFYFLFTVSEEVGSGASAILHGDIAEMLAVDNATVAPGQNSSEMGVTIAMMDSTGPFDYHLTRKLLSICDDKKITYARDVFRHYRCDAASAIEAGNDIRTALACFSLDASHGYERTHEQSLESLAKLVSFYIQSDPLFKREQLGPLKGFPYQPKKKLKGGKTKRIGAA